MTSLSDRARHSRLRPIAVSTVAAAVCHLVLAGTGHAADPASPPAPASPIAVQPATTPQPQTSFPAFLDDRRLQAIERHAMPRFEALAQRRAEKLRRRAVEADLKRKAEEMRRSVETAASSAEPSRDALVTLIAPNQANAAPVLPPAARNAPSAPIRATAAMTLPFALPAKTPAPAACGPGGISSTPLPGGRVALDISEPCRKGELVSIRYAPYVFMRTLDGDGRLRFVLDLFQGPEPAVSVVYASGESRPVEIIATDIDRVSKVAVIWGKPINLDLHVFEYAAASGATGHIWPKSPSDAEAAREVSTRTQRGHGFLSFASDGTEPGHQVEVYTLWHYPGQSGGVVATALDYETRGAAASGPSCGDGELAEIQFETITLTPRRPAVRERGMIPRAPCGQPLLERARFQDDAIADLPLSLE